MRTEDIEGATNLAAAERTVVNLCIVGGGDISSGMWQGRYLAYVQKTALAADVSEGMEMGIEEHDDGIERLKETERC
jgi:hypothetical protein